jgi:hypothetical protein
MAASPRGRLDVSKIISFHLSLRAFGQTLVLIGAAYAPGAYAPAKKDVA